MDFSSKEMAREARCYQMGSLKASPVLMGAGQEAEASFSARRQEVRVDEQKVCAYSMCETIDSLCEAADGERVTIEEGEVYCLNRSEHGVLVLMGHRPRNRQLIELHVAETRWEYSLNLYEVQWTKVVPVESQGHLFLVGCRLVLGASRYWAF